MNVFGEFEEFLGELYPYRWPIGIGLVLAAALVAWWGYRRGWHQMIIRHPRRSTVTAIVILAVALPVGYYLLSPLWTRTELYEDDPLAALVAPADGEAAAAASSAFAPQVVAEGTFAGADDFHFGEGEARLVETAPGQYVVRFEDFSVRNGPDLFVYLSPAADGYADGALNLGELKATDGAFNYEVPAGTDLTQFHSVIVWCKQFGVLFATAPLSSSA